MCESVKKHQVNNSMQINAKVEQKHSKRIKMQTLSRKMALKKRISKERQEIILSMTLLILVILVQNETINQKDSKRGMWVYNKQMNWKKAHRRKEVMNGS